MPPSEVRLYNPAAADRVAAVVAEPTAGEAWSVRVLRGPSRKALKPSGTIGPLAVDKVPGAVAEALTALSADGYWPAGLHALLTALQTPDAKVRARAALRLGWRRQREAVGALVDLLPGAVEEACAILDALGMIGDPAALEAIVPYSQRKLLSRRRSAVEAIHNIGEPVAADAVRERARELLDPNLRTALDDCDPDDASDGPAQLVADAFAHVPEQQRGLMLDNLYEVHTPLAVEAVRRVIPTLIFERAYTWRYVKSVLKRASLRGDAVTFGLLAYLAEARGRTTAGTTATVKSGLDGIARSVRIFGRGTQRFVRASSWRLLRQVGRWRHDSYADMAAEAVVHSAPTDAREPSGRYGSFSHCYLLQRVLYGKSKRLELDTLRLRFRYRSAKQMQPPANVREEPFPDLWDRRPAAYIRLLAAARLPEVHAFAVQAVESRHRAALEAAPLRAVLGMLRAPYEPTVNLGLAELRRRFDPEQPDWSLLSELLLDELPLARRLAHGWLRQTAPLWTADLELLIQFLGSTDADARALAAELVGIHLPLDAALRGRLAERLLAMLRAPEESVGLHEAIAQVMQSVLLEHLGPLLAVGELVEMILAGTPSAQAVAGALLARRPEAFTELGVERVMSLAQHPVAAVRSAAFALMAGAAGVFRDDPTLLLMLVESEWADTRQKAYELLQTVDLYRLGINGLCGLLDSTRVEVQEMGKELTRRHAADLSAAELIERLVQHPHPNMRPFTLELVMQHFATTPVPLHRMAGFCRSALMDTWPSRPVKRQVLQFVAERGLRDADEARAAAGVLSEVVRVRGRSDFEAALEALVRIRLAYPDVESAVTLRGEATA